MLGTYGKEVERFCGEITFEIDLDTYIGSDTEILRARHRSTIGGLVFQNQVGKVC